MSSYKKPKVKEEKSILASGFIPTEPEEINAQWLFEVINQYREVKNLSLLKKPDDILECEINERLNSRGYLSSTYIINCKFKVIIFLTTSITSIFLCCFISVTWFHTCYVFVDPLTFIYRVISSAINRICELSIMNDKEVSFKNSIDAAAQNFEMHFSCQCLIKCKLSKTNLSNDP